MVLEQACDWFGWPRPQYVLNPEGQGAAVGADLAKRKIGEPLKRAFPRLVVETGILIPDANGPATMAPLAVICHFPAGARPEALQEAHRLAWNFSRAALLITLEPHRLMAWSCFQDPDQAEDLRRICELQTPGSVFPTVRTPEQQQIRELLHWVSLVTGNFLHQRPNHFPTTGRADFLLLKNLKHVRRLLIDLGLDRNICHDLLARVIFTQFLFHRKDSAGNPFLSSTLLAKRCEGSLRRIHSDLKSILQDKDETYSLFFWLNDRFNGDLFPDEKDKTPTSRRAAWQAEKDAVKPSHLSLLADLVSGTIDTTDRQLRLWPQYAFDTIPLEFISSIYEEFLTEDRDASKAYYTPPHLVDYVLDAVLPWQGEDWNLKILDPACGSGIFLVKAFQRIIHRWRRQQGREPRVRDLKPLLANNLYGVDRNPDAVRVACFSLYLTMADAIDPKHYVTREKVFPRLRGRHLIAKDFFDETTQGFQTVEDAEKFDLIIGNAPWGKGSADSTSDIPTDRLTAKNRGNESQRQKKLTKAQRWSRKSWTRYGRWPIANNDIGPLFVAKSLHLVNQAGHVAMVQPAPPWLYYRTRPAKALRKKVFTSFVVDEVTNLSALRRELFAGVVGPACVLVVGRGKSNPQDMIFYFTPKPLRTSANIGGFHVEPHDVSQVTHEEAANDPLIWSVLALGGRRDLHLIRRLSRLRNLAGLEKEGKVLTRMGVIPGDQVKQLPDLANKPYFEESQFPEGVFLELQAAAAPPWDDPRVHSKDSTDFEAFKNPQLLIKQSFTVDAGRFRAALVNSHDPDWGVICKETYLSVRDMSSKGETIQAACLAYNSLIATYFLFLTSSRLGHFITEVPTKEITAVPLPTDCPEISFFTSFRAIDEFIEESMSLTHAERAIIEDFLGISLPDTLRKTPGPARRATTRSSNPDQNETEVSVYCKVLTRVLKNTFGQGRLIATTIYQEPDAVRLPVRMITVHLGWHGRDALTIEPIESNDLLDKLASFHNDILESKALSATGAGTGFRRVAMFFHSHESSRGRVRNLTIIKPDEYRYWTRSQAMRDADELSAAIMRAASVRQSSR